MHEISHSTKLLSGSKIHNIWLKLLEKGWGWVIFKILGWDWSLWGYPNFEGWG